MSRLIVLGIFAVSLSAQNAPNPYDLARSIDSHSNFDWPSLWKALGLAKPPFLPLCIPCSAEAITLFEPSQVILAVVGGPGGLYLRFLEDASGWRFAGLRNALNMNHGGGYGIIRIGDKRFLRVSSQGASSSGSDSEIEAWFDLSLPSFDPVFEFTVQGVDSRLESGVSREVHANATLGGYPAEAIYLDVEVRYFSGNRFDLGFAEYGATYERQPNQGKFSLREVSPPLPDVPTISNKDFEDLANIEGGPSNEQLLVYALPRLKEIASGSDAENQGWLRTVLSRCKDTPEKRTLQALLERKR